MGYCINSLMIIVLMLHTCRISFDCTICYDKLKSYNSKILNMRFCSKFSYKNKIFLFTCFPQPTTISINNLKQSLIHSINFIFIDSNSLH